MKRALVLGAIVLVGCKGGSSSRVKRDRDAAATVSRGPAGPSGPLETADEREPNDTIAQATPLAPGHVVHAVLGSDGDVDLYKVSIDRPGQLHVALGGLPGIDLVLEVRDASGAVIARSDRASGEGEGMPNLGVGKGDYYVQVSQRVKKKPAPPPPTPAKGKKKDKTSPPPVDAGAPAGNPTPPYQLSVEFADKPADLTEIEPDDDTGTAVEVLLADAVHGWIGWNGDIDLWKLALDGVGPSYCVDVSIGGVEGLTLTASILDASGKKLLTRKGAKGGPVEIKSLVPVLTPSEPPWYFVQISADHSNPDAPYELRFTARAREDDEEAEPNDDVAHATPLTGAGATGPAGVVRATYTAGDVDRFQVPAQEHASLLDLTLEPPAGVDLDLDVGVAGQPPIASAHTVGAGTRERLTGVALPAQTAVIVTVAVHGKPGKDDGGDARPYRLTWSIAEASADPMPPEEPADAGSKP